MSSTNPRRFVSSLEPSNVNEVSTKPKVSESDLFVDTTKKFMDKKKPIATIDFFTNTEEQNKKLLGDLLNKKTSRGILIKDTFYDDSAKFKTSATYSINKKSEDDVAVVWARFHAQQGQATKIISTMIRNTDAARAWEKAQEDNGFNSDDPKADTKFKNAQRLYQIAIDDYITSGKAGGISRVFAKCRKYFSNDNASFGSISSIGSTLSDTNIFTANTISDIRITNEKVNPFADDELQELKENFTLRDLRIIYDVYQAPDSVDSDTACNTSMTVGFAGSNSSSISSAMRENETMNCVFALFKNRLPNSDTVACRPEWTNGMTYKDIQDYVDEYAAKNGGVVEIIIKDRNGCKLLSNAETPNKIKGGVHTRDNNKKYQITMYQFNNHATDCKPYTSKELEKILKKKKINIQYVDDDTLLQTFSDYKGHQCVSFSKNTSGVVLYSWICEDAHYILKDPRIDRQKYPTACNYLTAVYSQMCNEVPGIPKKHKLKEMFQNIEIIVGYDENNNPITAKGSKMARCMPVGVMNTKETSAGVIKKIDMNRAYTTYDRCSYYQGKLMGVPMEEIYKCDNNILKTKGVQGHVFVRNIKPHFSIGVCPETGRDMTTEYINLHNGIMTYDEARYWNDNASIEVYAIIPSRVDDDALPQYLGMFNDDEKLLRNSLIGKMIANQRTTTCVVSDYEEANYLVAKYTEEGKKPVISEIGNKYIIEYKSEEYYHSKHQHIHNHIIGLTRIRMFQKIDQLLRLGCRILSCRVDSILLQVPIDVAIARIDLRKVGIDDDAEYYNYLDNDDRMHWKYENYDETNVKSVLSAPPAKREGYEIMTNGLGVYDDILRNQYISLEAPGGFGKTHYLKQLFKNAGFLAPTNCAAKLLPNGMTYDAYVGQLERYEAHPYQTIVLDEASMISINQFKKLEFLLRKFHRCIQPFGGVQIIISGDPAQLSPVCVAMKTFNNTNNIYSIMGKNLRTWDTPLKVPINIFCNDVYKKEFHTDYRRQGDDVFSQLLTDIRKSVLAGDKTIPHDILKRFTKLCPKPDELVYDLDTRYIAYTNATINKINDDFVKFYKHEANDIIIRKTGNGVYAGQHFKHDNGIIIVDNEERCISEFKYQPGYAMTSHLTQGMTIKNKIMIYLKELMHDPRAFYVAVSRATHHKNVSWY